MSDEIPTPPEGADAFLEREGWGAARREKLAGDASSRSYWRLEKPDARALLMIAPPGAETAPCPPEARPEDRIALGYNASARLAGPNLAAFTTIAEALRGLGLSAPDVYAADCEAGFALIEDLGDALFARVVGQHDEAALYRAAADVLLQVKTRAPAPPRSDRYVMQDYDGLALASEAALLIDWYWPLRKGAPVDGDVRSEFESVVCDLIAALSDERVLVLRDFHAENLLWLPDRDGLARVGVIDFQDGLMGAPAYDLVSLLEDARRDVAPALADDVKAYYCACAAKAGAFDEDQFRTDYAILSIQRNAKILGIFARLARRDGKTRYLDLLPRVEAHFRAGLARPAAAPMRRFIEQRFPELAP